LDADLLLRLHDWKTWKFNEFYTMLCAYDHYIRRSMDLSGTHASEVDDICIKISQIQIKMEVMGNEILNQFLVGISAIELLRDEHATRFTSLSLPDKKEVIKAFAHRFHTKPEDKSDSHPYRKLVTLQKVVYSVRVL